MKKFHAVAAVCLMALLSPFCGYAEETAQEEAPLIEVTLDMPGTLGVELLYQVDVLSDVKRLQVHGTLNAADWITLKNLSNIQYLDLGDCRITSVPNEEFYGKSQLEEIILPEGVTLIGEGAFYNCGLKSINIPASVINLSKECFRECPALQIVTFSSDAQLKIIDEYCFYNCDRLTEIIIPDNCSDIKNRAFSNCTFLSRCVLPLNICTIGDYAFYRTTSLQELIFPENLRTIGEEAFRQSGLISAILPTDLDYLDRYAFMECKSLQEVRLPSYLKCPHEGSFRNCTSLTHVISCALTPPKYSTGYDNYEPFSGVSLSNVKLNVPDVSVVAYKLDTYWKNFGEIEGGAEMPRCVLDGELFLTNDRRIDGKPDIEILSGSKLFISGNSPQEFGKFTYEADFHSNDSYSYMFLPDFPQLIINSASVTADEIVIPMNVKNDRWYFLSPIVDINIGNITDIDTSSSHAVRYYDGETRAENGSGGWIDVADDGVMEAGQGYILRTNNYGTMKFTVTDPDAMKPMFVSDDVELALNDWPSANLAHAGWNYVGNPYPCHYDTHYMDFTSPVTVWDHSNSKYVAYSLVDDKLVLKPMQSFFVQKPDGVNSIVFAKEGRQFESTANTGNYAPKRAASSERVICNISLVGEESADDTRIVMNPDASVLYEMECDAAKFFSSEPVAQLWSVGSEGEAMAINERPVDDGVAVLGFRVPSAGRYTLALDCRNESVTLEDPATGRSGNRLVFDFSEAADGSALLRLGNNAESAIEDSFSGEAKEIVGVRNGCITAYAKNVEIFSIEGKKMVTLQQGISCQLGTGIYVAVSGNKVSKVVVK